MKILHFADMHYDEKNFLEAQKCSDAIISEAKEKKPDVIICSGDVTNSEYLGASTKAANGIMDTFRRLSDIAPVAVIIGTPSHDGQTPALLQYVSGKFPIHVSTKPEQLLLIKEQWYVSDGVIIGAFIDGTIPESDIQLVVSQIPAPTKEYWKNRQGVEQDNFNMAEAMGAIFAGFGVTAETFPEAHHVLNGHFSMKGSRITETQLLPGGDISIGAEILAMANADLYCLGHIHMKQAYEILGKEICFHSGSTWRKNFGERKEDKGFFTHELDGGELYSEFIKTPTRVMYQDEFNLIENPELLDVDDFSETVSFALKTHAEAGNFIKIKITVYMDDIRLINQSKLKRLLLDAGASDVVLEIDRVRRENSRDDEIIKAVSLPEKVGALAHYRSEEAPEGVIEILENVERLNETDLVDYALSRIQ